MSGLDEGSGSYAVVWQTEDEPVATGKLTLERDWIELNGRRWDDHLAVQRIVYGEVTGVRIAHAPGERLNGGPTLILDRHSAAPVRIGTLGPGLLGELADLLARFSGEEAERLERLLIVVPLQEASLQRARGLIEQGPPFDPSEAGLERHDVFLTEREVVFLFEGHQVSDSVRRLARDPGLWRATRAWSGCLAGRPRLAELRYSWARGRR